MLSCGEFCQTELYDKLNQYQKLLFALYSECNAGQEARFESLEEDLGNDIEPTELPFLLRKGCIIGDIKEKYAPIAGIWVTKYVLSADARQSLESMLESVSGSQGTRHRKPAKGFSLERSVR
jgi:hypothetical protein